MFVSSRFRVFYLIHACPRCVYSRNNSLLVKFRIRERDVCDHSLELGNFDGSNLSASVLDASD
ncbi:hypothetical protein WN48_02569 [Eufriesea mexicana]|uniref:Uncharacterized protein n=1 Tax=Eufriesea mexicana TaxID=516756 RepID=A0A310SPB3_9HYME|nr:hypothetical protein WN48_02569 [Eufriesea mexicana]